MKKSLKIIFKSNYPSVFKLFIDYFLIAIILYLTNQIIDLPIVYSSLIAYLIFPFISIVLLYIFRVYNSMFRYFNIHDTIRLLSGLLLSSLILFLYSYYLDEVFIINQLLFFFISISFLLSYRILIKVIFSRTNKTSEPANNIMIFSAGNSGIITKRAFYNSSEFKILGFVDDDKYKIGKTLDGVTVFKLGAKLNKFIC